MVFSIAVGTEIVARAIVTVEDLLLLFAILGPMSRRYLLGVKERLSTPFAGHLHGVLLHERKVYRLD